MKRLLLFWLLLPFAAFAQAEFDEGVKIIGGQPDNTTPPYFTTTEISGLQTKIPSAYIAKTATTVNINGVSQDLSTNRSWRTAQSDTGVLTFAGLSNNSSTTINIGAVVGVVVDNETNPLIPTYTTVNYAGATGVTVTTVGSGQASYVMLSSAGVISFQTTFPTSAERKAKIWLGKVSHPAGAVTLVINEPDYITSPMAYSRDLLQSLGGFINNGVYPIENGANLNMNITGGTILGDGVNFVSSRTNPNILSMGPNTAATFSERTRTGGVTTGVTSINVGFYDVAGTVTAIPGGGATSTLRYIFAIPGQGYIVQYGQNTYTSLSNAIAAIGKESFVKWSNLDNNSILIGVLAATKSATSLRTQDGQAQFFQADRLGGLIGSSAGVSTATLQSAYNNSTQPQILTDATRLGVQIKRGSAADTDAILQGLDGSNNVVYSLKGNGETTHTASTTGIALLGQNGSTGVAVKGVSQSGTSGQFLSTSSTNPTLYAVNLSSGNIASFNNIGAEVAKIDNAGVITGTSFVDSNSTSTDALLAGGTTLGDAGAASRGFVNTTTQSFGGNKTIIGASTTTGSGLTIQDSSSRSIFQVQNAGGLLINATGNTTGASFFTLTDGSGISNRDVYFERVNTSSGGLQIRTVTGNSVSIDGTTVFFGGATRSPQFTQGSGSATYITKTEVTGTTYKFSSGLTNGGGVAALTNVQYQIETDTATPANQQFSMLTPFRVGNATTNSPSAIVQVVSTTKGSIPFPVMTSAQRLAISSPATGLSSYQTDGTDGVYINKSTGWEHGTTDLNGSAALDFLPTLTGTSSELTIAVTGAVDGDVVSLGVPSASVNANSCFTAFVSATNTVTVKFNNYSLTSIDPASGTFKVKILR